nr:DUF1292 domain-containing protein [Clostridia bacterium]
MSEKEKDIFPDESEGYFLTLTDEATGEDKEFELYARATIEGKDYFALAPVNESTDEYIILSGRRDGENIMFETVDDDDEFEMVEDYFNDLLFGEVNYDEN